MPMSIVSLGATCAHRQLRVPLLGRRPRHLGGAAAGLFVLFLALRPIAADAASVAATSAGAVRLASQSTATQDPDHLSVQRRFSQGMKALQNQRLRDAASAFSLVADNAQLSERRAAAASLARYALRLQALGVQEAPEDDPSAGRTTFIVMTTLASLYSGVVVLDIIDNNDARAGAAILLATTGIGLTASLFGSRGMRITESTGDAYAGGILYGMATGGLLGLATDMNDSEAVQISMLLGMGVGGAASFMLANRLRPTRGQVNFIGTAMVMGVTTTALGIAIATPQNIESSTLGWLLLGGLQLGAVAGSFVAEDVDWSLSRSRLVFLGAIVGSLAGGGTAVLVAGDSLQPEGIAGAALAGLWGGYGLAAWLTEDMTPDAKYRAPGTRSALVPTLLPNGGAGLAWAGRF